MFKQYLLSHPRLFTRLFYAAVVALSLLLAVPVVADYIGPQRTSTELVQVRDPDNDVWTMIHVDPNDQYADVCLIIHTCEQHPSSDPDTGIAADKPVDPVSYAYRSGTTDNENIAAPSTPEPTPATFASLLWGTAAIAAVAAVMAYSYDQRREREAVLAAARKRARQLNIKTSLSGRLKRLWKRGLQRT